MDQHSILVTPFNPHGLFKWSVSNGATLEIGASVCKSEEAYFSYNTILHAPHRLQA